MTWLSFVVLGVAVIAVILIVFWDRLRYRMIRKHRFRREPRHLRRSQ